MGDDEIAAKAMATRCNDDRIEWREASVAILNARPAFIILVP